MVPSIKIYAALPTERYLKLFLNKKVTVIPDYTLSNKDKFGSFIYCALQPNKYSVQLNDKKLNDQIKIIIPPSYEMLGKKELDATAIHLANNFLKNWFYEDFVCHMKCCDMFSLRMDKAIQQFCEMNGLDLDIDIQYETLKKKYYRWRENNGQPLHKYIVELVSES